MDVIVVGLVCRDLVLRVPRGEGTVTERIETLGGAANQAVALAQLGRTAGLVGVVGDDDAARLVLERAVADGLGVESVVRRAGTATALVVDVVSDDGHLLEHLPQGTWLTAADVRAARAAIGAARAVTVEMRQPAAAVVETVELAARAGALVLADGAPSDRDVLAHVLRRGVVIRADDDEAGSVMGRELDGPDDVRDAARELVAAGAPLAVLGAGAAGNVLAWPGGDVLVPLLGGEPVDTTGGGDAFVAGLVDALLDGVRPPEAGRWASAAAALTVARPGGRPALARAAVSELAAPPPHSG